MVLHLGGLGAVDTLGNPVDLSPRQAVAVEIVRGPRRRRPRRRRTCWTRQRRRETLRHVWTARSCPRRFFRRPDRWPVSRPAGHLFTGGGDLVVAPGRAWRPLAAGPRP